MDSITNSVNRLCLQQGVDKTYWLAYSGGVDSHVLVHAFSQIAFPIKCRVVYVNHGLSSNSAAWGAHCAQICRELNLPFQEERISLQLESGQSIEELARTKRYAIFAKLLQKDDVLVTAHHQNDQAETLLIQMMRGAGLKGLSAMPSIKSFSQGWHSRVLLNVTRDQIMYYALLHQLTWICDESNSNVRFSRNYLRHEVLPRIEQRWPAVANILSRVATHCAEAQEILDEVAQEDLLKVQGSLKHTVAVQKLLSLSSARQKHVLRFWLQKLNFPSPSLVKLKHIQTDLLQAQDDKLPHITWQNVEIRRYRDTVYAQHIEKDFLTTGELKWNFEKPLILSSSRCLKVEWQKGNGLRQDILHVTVKFRQGAEKIRLPNRKHHHYLKKLYQEWGVPPWERDRLPLLYMGHELVCVVGYWLHEKYRANPQEEGRLVTLTF